MESYHWTANIDNGTSLNYMPCGIRNLISEEVAKAHRDVSLKSNYHPGDKDYKRIIPAQYQQTNGQGGDNFMASAIQNWAVEGGKDKGKPNGQFWFEPYGAQLASKKVVMDYIHVSEQEAENIVCSRFNTVWNYYDVNNEGKIDADRMPRFWRELTGIQLNLQ